jgi:hypothetical protein
MKEIFIGRSITRVARGLIRVQQFTQPLHNLRMLIVEVIELMWIIGKLIKLSLHSSWSWLNPRRQREAAAPVKA